MSKQDKNNSSEAMERMFLLDTYRQTQRNAQSNYGQSLMSTQSEAMKLYRNFKLFSKFSDDQKNKLK